MRTPVQRLAGVHSILPFAQAERLFTRVWRRRRKLAPPQLSHALSAWSTEFSRWELVDRNGKPVGTVTESGVVTLMRRVKT